MAKKVARYDDSNAKKGGIGVFVVMSDGRQLLFDDSAAWKWKTIKGVLYLEVEESGEVALHARDENVMCVGGPQVLFRDADWK